MRRYHRQTILPEVGSGGQEKLIRSRVLVVGAGGLGHPAAQYLAAMGVGQIKIVDGDFVHVTNLPRQVLFNDADIGENKAEVLARKIGSMNTGVTATYLPRFLDRSLALNLFADFDLVLDCTDRFESKFLINDVCALYDRPMIYGAVSQFEGQVGVFWKSKGACYRCLHSAMPASRIQNCAEAGVVGPVVGTIGTLQAFEAMKLLLGPESGLPSMAGKLGFYDLRGHSFRSLSVTVRSDCPCHAAGFSESNVADIEGTHCAGGSSALLVDVRESDEWNGFHIEGSYNFPLSRLESGDLPEFAKDRKIILICKAGVRAEKAEKILKKMNYRNISRADRGVHEYQDR